MKREAVSKLQGGGRSWVGEWDDDQNPAGLQ